MTTDKDLQRAREQAQAQLETLREMVKALNNGTDYEGQDASEAIQEDPLSVEIRTDWHTPGDGNNKPTEYTILLCTGGPAVRIIGDLDQYCQPETTKLEYQDWFTPWTRYLTDDDEEADMVTYANQFYYEEVS